MTTMQSNIWVFMLSDRVAWMAAILEARDDVRSWEDEERFEFFTDWMLAIMERGTEFVELHESQERSK